MTTATELFRTARDFLLEHREDYTAAYEGFRWPRPANFNWALDWFDVVAEGNGRTALHIVEEDGREVRVSFAEMSARSNRVANRLREWGVGPEDRILVMLGNQAELWETALAAMKLRAVVIPATTLLGPADLRDRVDRGRVGHVIARAEDTGKFDDVPGHYTRVAVGGATPAAGWRAYEDVYGASDTFTPDGPTAADDPLMLYFTSGTTARPKLVEHTHVSYPVGHLATMYWIGLKPGDVHLNISSPGWAKHAWSNLFAPWNAEATVFLYNYTRFDATRLMAEMDRAGVTTFCAPPTVWRMLIQADLTRLATPPREVVAAGEPLNPEVIEQVRRLWGRTIRDGFGQTETAVQVSNSPGQVLKTGSMGRPSPGYRVELLDPVTGAPGAAEGEIALDLSDHPVGLMTGYHGDPDRTAEAMAGGYYRTGDIGARDEDGYLTYVGRADDVFKASDYKISPFELESALLEHEAVAEAAVVPAPDALRLAVPKAYIVLAAGWEPGPDTAKVLFEHSRDTLAAYKRVRRLEFGELPKTVSGKIRRIELREATAAGSANEYREEDFR
ncbi:MULTISPECIES: isobutyrate:CoA ligase IbuL [Streptomyces]|uniref:Acetyl-coenzyme A synthetase n=1 Tax=Streptomyces coelicolor (strain ATCC BAA-471 / A3(2) / M145) TaxID=100226 RepID=Q9Z5A7_STRCO|nr:MULTISPECIES: isobutyrate:CoA ligase IbuL [Streptomyces]WTE17753.1 isobutyrate:CoA ligase IbuL [Streptomyces anthocyanicus]MDX2926484.1 isobutyrate:CoA ligase IbuL [Streptomyces sp. NRRL_B-16638]MDX3405416.1 isobutyrate:CoA ligase IbuL [Streptomyces sp. ME02-6977A]MYU45714.1 AMP-binding protein [Streptomyces sp. SID7813]NSL81345.1 AMP-binding protein [Streptomyces coelicolor]